ncbi:hypothetical protein JCM3775_007528 [Rhodotorula graminis]|uniref:Uncharacterized protein n=1 Tax=Rhodotorula graminis (strain WP1) TaxID=578459 RepID=A0A0N8PZB5_RHOGW|nr:uncharacterized protein RHOBADRAFT_56249 [Rhodotorula graminis WP1]KPV71861.1 hypothetical protein RHOBADRAFT_56249 [Rhodotorula graminis WP1]
MLVRLSTSLAAVDHAVAAMGLCSGFVFELPPDCDAAARLALLQNLHSATRRVTAQWALLRGRPRWLDEDKIWAIDVPDETATEDKPYLFTSATVTTTYTVAAGLSSPLTPLSPTSPCTVQPQPKTAFFRHDALPTSFQGYADANASLLAVHVTTFADAVTVGLSAPHGLFDATGLGLAVRALSAELHGHVWQAPALSSENALDVAIESLPTPPSSGPVALPGWTSATSVGPVVKFLVNYVVEKAWYRDEKKYLFLNEQVVSRLVQSTKAEAAVERRWVSAGDTLTAWLLKSAHREEVGEQLSITGSAVYTLRKMLSLANYPHNAMLPYPLTPDPISLDRLASLSLAELAYLHRRALEAARTPAHAQGVVKKMEEARVVPEHSWPQPLAFLGRSAPPVFRWISSNQMSSGVADLALPLSAFGLDRPPLEAGQSAGLLAYYMLVVSPIRDHQVFRFQANKCGIFLEGSMRRSRWRSVEKTMRELQR